MAALGLAAVALAGTLLDYLPRSLGLTILALSLGAAVWLRRRAGVDLPPPEPGAASEATRISAERAYEKGQGRGGGKRQPRVAKAVKGALQRESGKAASPKALSKQASAAAARRTSADRSAAARRAARTKGPAKRSAAAKKAARTRAARSR